MEMADSPLWKAVEEIERQRNEGEPLNFEKVTEAATKPQSTAEIMRRDFSAKQMKPQSALKRGGFIEIPEDSDGRMVFFWILGGKSLSYAHTQAMLFFGGKYRTEYITVRDETGDRTTNFVLVIFTED